MNGEIDSLKAKQIELSLNYHKKNKKTHFICFSDTALI